MGWAETRSIEFPSLALDSGLTLAPLTLAYETYGTLNAERSNAILLLHALSGDAHAAGYHPGDKKPGWWDIMVGPGRAFDTDKYFMICSNVIGGCKGSSGPGEHQPRDGPALRPALPRRDGARHGAGAGHADRSPRHRPAAGGRRRLHGRHAGARVDHLVPRAGGELHPHRVDAPALAHADRLQRGRSAGHHARPQLARAATTTTARLPTEGWPWPA